MSLFVFGKLPSAGDFVSRGFDAAARDALDLWITQSLSNARLHSGVEFEDAYDAAPPWLYCITAGPQPHQGALIPSIDAAGRRFPLLVAHGPVEGMRPAHIAATCCAFARAAIIESWSADQLAQTELSLDCEDEGLEPPVEEDCWWTPASEGYDGDYRTGHRPRDIIDAMLGMRERML